MANNRTTVVIMARESPLRDGLKALLTALPHVEIIGEADDLAAGLELAAKHHPDIVVLDLGLPSDATWAALRYIKAISPRTRRVMLADDVRQQEDIALPAAEAVLLKGALPTELIAVIERLRTGQGVGEIDRRAV